MGSHLLSLVILGLTAIFQIGGALSSDSIVINEFDVEGSSRFIELYDGGIGGKSLDSLVVVLFSGQTEMIYAQPLVLDGYRTDRNGYFVVSYGVPLPNANLTSSTVLITTGLNAIALYNGSSNTNLRPGAAVTEIGLVDAVVYGTAADPQQSGLVRALSEGDHPLVKGDHLLVKAGSMADETSLSRCRGWRGIMHSSFRTVRQTPGADNACSLPSFVLNEINTVAPNATLHQFVEISDGGIGHQSLDGVMLVTYNTRQVDDNVFLSVDMTGFSTNENGFLVLTDIGADFGDVHPLYNPQNKLLKKGSTAIALHLGPPQKFTIGNSLSDRNIIDAIVIVREGQPDHRLVSWLTPGQHGHVDAPSNDFQDYSISRCYCCSTRNSSVFGIAPVSPGLLNRDCSIANRTIVESPELTFRISEVHIGSFGSSDGDFIEVYDGGFGPAFLTGLVLVLYAGNQDGASSYKIMDISNYATKDDGYFLMAPSSVGPVSGRFDLNADWLRAGLRPLHAAGAAVLYKGNLADFGAGHQPTTDGLVDAVLFGNRSALATKALRDALLPGQMMMHDFMFNTSSSILRCYSHDPIDQVAFVSGAPSPAAPNVCPRPPFVLNEINALDTSSTSIWVEISSMGIPNFPMDSIILVRWLSSNPLNGAARSPAGLRTDQNGFVSFRLLRWATDLPGPFAVAIYFVPDATDLYREGGGGSLRLTAVGLMDAVVFAREDTPEDQTLTNVLGVPQVQERESFSHRDESLSRCLVDGQWQFVMAHATREAVNYCPTRADPDVIINEINLADQDQFIELFDLGAGYTFLDDLVVVLYGATSAIAIIPLAGYATDASGYFVLGVHSSLHVGRIDYAFAAGLMDSTTGAVALYRSTGDSFDLVVGDAPTATGLFDSVVYAYDGSADASLRTLLAANYAVLASSNERYSRCFSSDLRSPGAFGSRPITIAAMNDCPVFPDRDVVINELYFDDLANKPVAYVELYDGGIGNTDLTYVSLVMFSAADNNGAYTAIDMSGYSTNAEGYFLVGSVQTANLMVTLERIRIPRVRPLPIGAGAAALYRAHPGVFYHGAPATKTSLIDAVVFTLDLEEDTTLVQDLLPPGSFIIYWDKTREEQDTVDESISRCFDETRQSQSAFKLTPQTPRQRNLCGKKEPTHDGVDIFINEVNVKAPSGFAFVELYDGGSGNTPLDGYLLVFFDGHTRDRSFYEVDLTGKRTDASGYLVIGGSRVDPSPGVLTADLLIPSGPGAIAIYQDSLQFFPRGTVATEHYLVDVVVYGEPTDRADGLNNRLVPGQIQAYESSQLVNGRDASISRCLSLTTLTMAAFVSAPQTPGSPNSCGVYQSIYINEIKPFASTFIELYDGGAGFSALDALVLVLSTEGGRVPYAVVPLTGNHTDSDGFYVITGVPGLLPKGSAALYRGNYAMFDINRAPPSDAALVDIRQYNTGGLDDIFIQESPTARSLAFSRCQSCRSPGTWFLALSPASPGQINTCPSSTFNRSVLLKLVEASYDVWVADSSLVSSLERTLVEGINSQCRCNFSIHQLCDSRLKNGSVIYQANMHAPGAALSRRLEISLDVFILKNEKITVVGKTYSVVGEEMTGNKHTKLSNGKSPAVTIVAVLLSLAVVVIVTVAIGYYALRKRRLSKHDDSIKLEVNSVANYVTT